MSHFEVGGAPKTAQATSSPVLAASASPAPSPLASPSRSEGASPIVPGAQGASQPSPTPGGTSGTACPAAQFVLNGTESDTTVAAGSTDYWAASYPSSEAGEWLTGFEVTSSVAFVNAGTGPGSATALVELELTPVAYAPWGGTATSLLAPPPGVAVASWTLYLGGGNDASGQTGSQSCLTDTVPSADPYVTVVVSAGSSTLSKMVTTAAMSVDMVAPGAAGDCRTGQGIEYGGQTDSSPAAAGVESWASSDPSALVGEAVSGFEVSLSGAYSVAPTATAAYASVEAMLVLAPRPFTAWNSSGQAVPGLPAGAEVVGVFEVPVATTQGSGAVAVSTSCLDLVVPSTLPYLSLLLVVNSSSTNVLSAQVETTTFVSAAGIVPSGCEAGGMPQYGGESDVISSGSGGSGLWAASDPTDLSGDYLNSFQTSVVESYAGAPSAVPSFGTTLFWLFLSPVAYSGWNSGGQSVPSLPSGSLVLGAWSLSTGSGGDQEGTALYVSCLHLVVPNGQPYLSLLVDERGAVGLTSEVQSVTYATVTTHSTPCSIERNPTAQLGQEDSVTPASTTAWWAASAPGTFGGDRVSGLTLSTSIAPNPGVAALPGDAYSLVWLLSTSTLYAGNNGPGTSLTGFPAGTVLASLKLATGSGFGSLDESVSLSCLDAIVPSGEPYLTTMIQIVSGPGGNLDAEVQSMVRAEPPSEASPCLAPASLRGPSIQAGGEADTLSSSGIGWFVASDPTNLSGEVVTSVAFSASLTFGTASATPTFGEALFALFFSRTPYTPWDSAGQSLGSFPPETAPVGQWILKTGSANESAAESSDATCLVVPVPRGAPYLSLMVDPLAASTPSLAAEMQVAVGTATPTPLTSVATVYPPSGGDAGRTSFFLSAAPTGGVAPYQATWSLGDGTWLQGHSQNHTYTSPGNYAVNVWTNDSLGNSTLARLLVPVSALPRASISASPSGAVDAGENVAFSANVSGGAPPVTFLWKFGDGGAGIFENTSHVYRFAGSYAVRFFANDSTGDSVNSTLLLAVHPAPTASPSVQPSVGEAGTALSFLANASGGTAPITWTWTFGDGGRSTQENTTHTYASEGTFLTTLYVNDSAGTELVRSLPVVVDPPLSTSLGFSANDVRVGGPNGITVSAGPSGGTGTYRFAWDLNGSSLPESTPSFSFGPRGAGNFTFSLVVTDSAGYSTSANGVLTMLPPLVVLATASPENSTLGSTVQLVAEVYAPEGPISYAWSFLPAPCEGADAPSVSCAPSSAGHFAVRVVVTDSRGVQAAGYVGFTINGPPSRGPSFLSSPFLLEVAALLGAAVLIAVVVIIGHRRNRRAAEPPAETGAPASEAAAFVPVPLTSAPAVPPSTSSTPKLPAAAVGAAPGPSASAKLGGPPPLPLKK
ncbi:MAG: PKD domain-containing protein [Euryarchaeota archaeon]|nr:PKD domain-containing protein [Euryarchaeota archaeon]